MKTVDERSKGKRRNLSEVGIAQVVRLDDNPGFWMRKYRDTGDGCALINIETAITLHRPEHTEVTLVNATVTITDA